MPDIANEIYEAIEKALATGIRTADIAKPGETAVSTTEMTAAIVACL
jgi:3-isopropylmalate dehydrogenase